MFSNWVISPTYKCFFCWGYNPLILTLDPNFQRDIQVEGKFLSRVGWSSKVGWLVCYFLRFRQVRWLSSFADAPEEVE